MNAISQDQIHTMILQTLEYVVPNVDARTLDPDISFHDQLNLDSIDFLRLMLNLEKELRVTIFDFDYPQLSTLNGCEHYVADQMALAA
jgi:acyl carrier protein